MLHTYFPVLLLLGFVIANAVLMLGLSHLTLRPRPTAVKSVPYESGIPPLGDAHERFSVKFYMVAVLFILFDIETVFMIPWGAYSGSSRARYRSRRTCVPQVTSRSSASWRWSSSSSFCSWASSTCGRREHSNGIDAAP